MEHISQSSKGGSSELPPPLVPIDQNEGGVVDHDTTTPSAPSGDLSRRESKKVNASTDKVGLTAGANNVDIDAEVSQIAAHWRGSATDIIAAGAGLSRVWKKLDGNDEGRKAVLAGLRDKRVLSENDIKLRHRTSKVSKLIKVGEHAEFLLQEKLLPCLPPSYASLHQLLVWFERLKGSPEEKLAEVISSLDRCKDEITWEFLSQETKKAKHTQPGKGKPARTAAADGGFVEDVFIEPAGPPQGELSDLLLITPRPEDVRRIQETYADPTTLHRWLPLHQYLADSAVVVFVTKLSDMSLIETRLLPLCGPGLKRVFLLPRCPTSIDATDEPVLVVAVRGDMQINLPKDGWLGDIGPMEWAKVVRQLVPGAKHRLHLFGDLQHDGWHRLLDADTGAHVPSVR